MKVQHSGIDEGSLTRLPSGKHRGNIIKFESGTWGGKLFHYDLNIHINYILHACRIACISVTQFLKKSNVHLKRLKILKMTKKKKLFIVLHDHLGSTQLWVEVCFLCKN